MENRLHAVKNLFLYGGLSKESFKASEQLRMNSNFRQWRICTAVASLFFTMLYSSTFILSDVKANRILYLIVAIISILSFAYLCIFKTRSYALTLVVIYLMTATLMVFSLVRGVFFAKGQLAVTFHAFLLVLPLITTDKPYRMAILISATVIAFIICCASVKTGITKNLDIYNAYCFWALSLFLNFLLGRGRMKAFYMTKQIESFGLTDSLTQIQNRFAFEKAIIGYQKGTIPNGFAYVSLDVNGLKETNDKLGHAAGDELLCAAAECIKNSFSPYGKVYRVGGDEFVALLIIPETHLEVLKERFQNTVREKSKKSGIPISISAGYVTRRENSKMGIEEYAKKADIRMYQAKAQYYQESGHDRRRR